MAGIQVSDSPQGLRREPNNPVKDYFSKYSFQHAWLCELMELGWKNAQLDQWYKNKKSMIAKGADSTAQKKLFQTMQRIGEEIDESTKIFSSVPEGSSVLHLCMAPGGYSQYFHKVNPKVNITAVTLPELMGGHPILYQHRSKASTCNILQEDVALLGHRSYREKVFSTDRPRYQSVVADGQYLKSYEQFQNSSSNRLESDKSQQPDDDFVGKVGPLLLQNAQLITTLEGIRSGGSFIILLHGWKWRSLQLICEFAQFSEVRLFKSQQAWAERNSYYLVCSNVKRGLELERVQARLECEWQQAKEASTVVRLKPNEEWDQHRENLRQFLEQQGKMLIPLFEPVWETMISNLTNKLIRIGKLRRDDLKRQYSQLEAKWQSRSTAI